MNQSVTAMSLSRVKTYLSFVFPRHVPTKAIFIVLCFVVFGIVMATTNSMLPAKGKDHVLSGLVHALIPMHTGTDVHTTILVRVNKGLHEHRNNIMNTNRIVRESTSMHKSTSILKSTVADENKFVHNTSMSRTHEGRERGGENKRRLNSSIDSNRKAENHNPSNFDSISFRPQQTCALPRMDVMDPFMMRKVKKPRRPSCQFGHPSWLSVVNGSIVLSQNVLHKAGNFTCDFIPLVFYPGEKGNPGLDGIVPNIPNGFLIPDNIFRVDCRTMHRGAGLKPRHFSHIFHGVTEKDWQKFPKSSGHEDKQSSPLCGLSVLFLGFPSVSRMSWLRRLSKSRHYFIHTLGGIELKGYQALGDGMEATLFPMLTGMSYSDVTGSGKPVDSLPWLWDNFAKLGHITSLAIEEDDIFSWKGGQRLLGFRKQPTHYDLGPFYSGLRTQKPGADSARTFCLRDVAKHVDWLNWARDLFYMHEKRPKFMFHVYSSLSNYDNNDLMLADDDLQAFLADLHLRGYLNSTVVVLMSDHGSSLSDVTSTWYGKVEERLPYMAFSFPAWFHENYSNLIRNLKNNVDHLTTPFDVYETLKFLASCNKIDDADHNPSSEKKGINLFKGSAVNRTCHQVNISRNRCACLKHQSISNDHEKTQAAALEAVQILNELLYDDRALCSDLKLTSVLSADRWMSHRNAMFASEDNDLDIDPSDLEDNVLRKQEDYYRVTFTTVPGLIRFEATVTHRVDEDSMRVKPPDIRRVDRSNHDPNASCLSHVNESVRMFCVCK